MLYASETWRLRKNEVDILKRGGIYGEGDVWCKVGAQEEYSEADEHGWD